MKVKVHCNTCKKDYQYDVDVDKIAVNQALFVSLHKHKNPHLHTIWINSSGEIIKYNEFPLNSFAEEFSDISSKNIFPLRVTEKEFIFAEFSDVYEFPSIDIFIFKDPSEDLKSSIINFKKLTNQIMRNLSSGRLLNGLVIQKLGFFKLSRSLNMPKFLEYPISVSLTIYFLSDNLVTPKVVEYNNYLVPVIPRTYMYDILLSHTRKKKPAASFRLLGSYVGLFYLFSILSMVLAFSISVLNITFVAFNIFTNYYLLLYLIPLATLIASGHFKKQAKKFETYLFDILNFNTNTKEEWKNYQQVNLMYDVDLSILKDDIYLHMSKAYSSILAAKTDLAINSLKSVYRSILSLYSGIKFGFSFDTQAVIKKLSAELGYPYRQLLTFWDILSISKTGIKTTKISSIELMYIYNAIYEICIQLNLLEQSFPNFKEYIALRKPPLKESATSSVILERTKLPIEEPDEKSNTTKNAPEVSEITKTNDERSSGDSKDSGNVLLKEKVIELTPKLELSLDDILTLKTEEMISRYIEDAYMSEDPVFIYFKTGSEKENDLNELLMLFSTIQTNYPDSITLIAEVVPESFQTEIEPGQILYLDKGQRKVFNVHEIRQALAVAKPTQD